MIKLIIVDDHPVVRAGLSALLAGSSKFTVVAQAENGQHLLDLLAAGVVAEMVISDIEMPVMDGLSMLSIVSASHPQLLVVMLSMKNQGSAVEAAYTRGAKAFISKSLDLALLAAAIKYIYEHSGRYSCGIEKAHNSQFVAIDERL
jgi:DNA-binding NarL/FixJ family response regulator